MLLNCGVGKESWESLGLQEDQTSQSRRNQSWTFIGRTNAKAETPILWPPDVKNWLLWRPWCWERLKEGGEGDNRGWDGWMASPTRWTWIWWSSRSWWWTEKPGMLQSMQSDSQTWLSTELRLSPFPPCVLSRVWLFVTPWTIARQAPLFMEFSRPEYWSGLPFPTSGDLLDPGLEPACLASLALAGELSTTNAIRIVHFHLLDKYPPPNYLILKLPLDMNFFLDYYYLLLLILVFPCSFLLLGWAFPSLTACYLLYSIHQKDSTNIPNPKSGNLDMLQPISWYIDKDFLMTSLWIPIPNSQRGPCHLLGTY